MSEPQIPQPSVSLSHITPWSVQAAIEADRKAVGIPKDAPVSGRLAAKLEKELIPFERDALGLGGSVAYIANPDPILRYLSQKGEAEWREMERADSTIKGEVEKRKKKLLSYGTELVAAGETPAQKFLFDATLRNLKNIRDWSEVQYQMLNPTYWGWCPYHITYEQGLFQGRRMWFQKHVREHNPEDFAFNTDRELLYLGEFGREKKLNSVSDRFQWMTLSAGSTNSPYGVGLYRFLWMTYYLRQRYLEIMTAGSQRSTGIIQIKQQTFKQGEGMMAGAAGAQSQAKTTDEMVTEGRQMLAQLSNEGFIVVRAGWDVIFGGDIEATDSWMKQLEYFDKQIRIIVNTGTLTSDIGNVGSRAATETQADGMKDNCVSDSKKFDSWCNDDLLSRFLLLNFGETDPDDRPKLRSKISTQVSLDNAQKMFDMGAAIDGKRVAQDAGVPLAAGDEAQVLKKQEPPKLGEQGALPFGEPRKPAGRKERNA